MVSVPGDNATTVMLQIAQLTVFRFCVYAVLSIHPFPSPNRAKIISPLVGLPAQNEVLRKLVLSHDANTLLQINTISGIRRNNKNDFLIFISWRDDNKNASSKYIS